MTKDYKALTKDISEYAGELSKASPDAINGFYAMSKAATAYINKDGSYVVRNNKTGDIVQISNRNNPNWKAPWD